MELFAHAKAVRLKSRHDKFLYADEDELHVTQDRNGSSPSARWTVEPVPHAPGAVRLRGRYGRYLAASTEPFLLGMTGRKVLQAAAAPGGRPDASVEWEPVRDGFQVRLKSRAGGVRGGGDKYLRANGGVPPWRNSVTHDVPHRTATQDWVLWDVEIVQVVTPGPATPAPEKAASAPPAALAPDSPPAPKLRPAPTPYEAHHRPTKSQTSPPPPDYAPPPPPPRAKPEPRLSKLESSDSFSAPLHKVEGRAIHYHIADDKGDVDDDIERRSFTFNGSNLEELTQKLQEETGIDDLIVCTRSPISGKLTPLLLQLPPNNAAMHIVLVRESSKVAKTFPWPYGS
ncbi:uncharacterized protein LOC123452792 [Hordeum vulgare subsp. vulgare]|uniref:DUF569 domain-containing protein n=1 Tax=Hordeum vulgare subsp. vulgare TaxID=112509 RepID=A0A8I6XLY1_HORVV|nr:uncharacterized protein LOC123452792 [Hordeum vulgare subsp. vulgare]KAI4985639.1 hypothetical protein ZWY2020_018269 [Hordeum vulgare]